MGKNKKLRKSIESFEKRIKEHEEKIEGFESADSFLKDYWEKEIVHFRKLKQEKEQKLRKNKN